MECFDHHHPLVINDCLWTPLTGPLVRESMGVLEKDVGCCDHHHPLVINDCLWRDNSCPDDLT